MTKLLSLLLTLLAISLFSLYASAQDADYVACVSDKAFNENENLTLREIRERCRDSMALIENTVIENNDAGLISERLSKERDTQFSSWVITPHKPNYVLPIVTSSGIN